MSKNHDKKKAVEIDDHIAKRFEIRKRIGKGAYGIVWKALDRKSREVVALKKIYDAFRNPTDAQRTFREIMFLQAFRDHPNIVRLYSIHRATNNQDIYLGFEYMETDLHNVIKRGNILKDIHKRYIMYQMLSATRYIHSGNVIHRDQKPSNVLLDSSCRAKIADFGLARSVSHRDSSEGEMEVDPSLTNYVATRWYRAPEILTASKKYSKCVDMWSLGCILGEMLRGKPLFQGSSTVNQVEKIMAALPTPSQEDIISVCSGYGSALVSTQPTPDKSLHSLMESYPSDARDLVESLIVFNPNHRLTAAEALDHQYVSRFYRKSGEMVMPYNVVPPLRDDVQLTVEDYRSKLYEFINTGTGHCSAPAMVPAKLNGRSHRSAMTASNQRLLPSTPQPPPPPSRQRSLIIRPRREHPDVHAVYQRPQTVVKRGTGQGDEHAVHASHTDQRRVSHHQQSRHQIIKSTSTGNNDKIPKQQQPNPRKAMSGKPHIVASEPKICCKRRMDFNEASNMIPAAGDIGRMQHGFSNLSLTNPALYQRHQRRSSDSNVRSKLEVIHNHGDHLDNKGRTTMMMRQTQQHGKAEMNHYHHHQLHQQQQQQQQQNQQQQHHYVKHPPRNNILSHSNLESTTMRYNRTHKDYTNPSTDEGSNPVYRYKDYGVITASALHELTRNLRSGVR